MIAASIIGFLIMLNPFALFLYLQPVMKDLEHKLFLKVLAKATFISGAIFFLFMVTGDLVFRKVFLIHFDSFRIFGGIVLFSFAYLYIVKGQKALVHMKEDLDDLASEIALPFMVGAGTISLSVILGTNYKVWFATILLVIVLIVKFIIILLLKRLKENLDRKRFRVAFDKVMEMLMRLMGFFLGSIGVNMIVVGIRNLFF